MTLTTDHRAELLASTPLLAGVDPEGIQMLASRMVEVWMARQHT